MLRKVYRKMMAGESGIEEFSLNGSVFYAIFRPWAYVSPGQPGYPWPTIGNDATNYWAGRDGYFYALDEDNGDVLWTWNPRGRAT